MMSYNLFRMSADLLHLGAMLILLYRVRYLKTCAGISLKTQELYCVVFLCRYLDLFWNWSILYNVVMKIIFIAATIATVYLMRFKYQHTYDKEHDTFRVAFLLVPCAVLAVFVHEPAHWSVLWEIVWMFSIYLESVAILPQLFLVQRTHEVETMNSNYIFCLGLYRGLYLVNWIYRYLTEHYNLHWAVLIAGLVQTGLYADFFYYYFISKVSGRKLKLPE